MFLEDVYVCYFFDINSVVDYKDFLVKFWGGVYVVNYSIEVGWGKRRWYGCWGFRIKFGFCCEIVLEKVFIRFRIYKWVDVELRFGVLWFWVLVYGFF